jgi:acyl-CoA dehydrogenase
MNEEANTLGGWELPEELRSLQDTVRRFMAGEVKPVDEAQPHDAYELPTEVLADLQAKAKRLGLWCVQSPAEYGGAGLNILGQCVVAEEAAKCRMGAYFPACGAFGADPPLVIFNGTRAQIEKYGIPSVESGETTFVAISEPGGGSDPSRAIATRAERKGDHYVLNGSKLWITGISKARWGILFARTDKTKGRGGITSFIIDTDRPGITWRKVPVMRSYAPNEVHLTDYEVPVENRLGEEGEGFALADKWLVHARIPYAAISIGIARAALELAVEWSKSRQAFGSALADKQAIQWMLADSEIELRAAKLLVYQAAWKADRGEDAKVDASIAKVYGTETAHRVLDRCIQIFGGMGAAQELPLERWYREGRIRRIGEGPSEVHRMVVARDMVGRRR